MHQLVPHKRGVRPLDPRFQLPNVDPAFSGCSTQ
jgi:hypothetical protein